MSTIDAPITPPKGVIVLDEDPVIENYLERLLARRGYRVVKARASTAIEMVRSGEVLLVITNTPESFTPVANDVALLYLSASPNPALIAPFRRCLSVSKPFHPGDLYDAVKELTESGA